MSPEASAPTSAPPESEASRGSGPSGAASDSVASPASGRAGAPPPPTGGAPGSRSRRFPVRLGLLLAVAGLLLVAATVWSRMGPLAPRGGGAGPVVAALADQPEVLLVGGERSPVPLPRGVRPVRATPGSPLAAALAGDDPGALAAALGERGLRRILIRPRSKGGARGAGAPLAARLQAADRIPGFRGVVLARRAFVYAPGGGPEVPPELAPSLAVVARALLAGARPPRLTSFPEAFRTAGNVEVMVLLRERGQARLWRSARGSSVARGLITAALVARRRWTEREGAMGGPLDRRLPALDVEVSLLREDGTVVDASPAFVDRVFGPEHGVAYERKGAWRYLLPAATAEAGAGSAREAYRDLFAQHGLPEDSLARRDLRLYRMVVEPLAVLRAATLGP